MPERKPYTPPRLVPIDPADPRAVRLKAELEAEAKSKAASAPAR